MTESWKRFFPVSTELSYFVGHSPSQMENLKQSGLVSDRLYRHYLVLWLWSSHRQDWRHEQFYRKFGPDRYWRRIEKIKALVEKIAGLKACIDYRHAPLHIGTLNR